MRALLPLTPPLLGLLMCASCSSFRSFQYAVVPRGGHDGPSGADQIYFELRNVKGIGATGIAALVLPADWMERDLIQGEDGIWLIQPPLSPSWSIGREMDPKVVLASRGEGVNTLRIISDFHDPLDVPLVPSASALKNGTGNAANRLGGGDNAYAMVLSVDEEKLKEYRLFGAARPMAGAGSSDVRWVELTQLRFEDSRGAVARVLDVPVRRVPFLEAAAYTAALIWPVFVF